GIDGNTPLGTYDFVTAALHELAHGFGFIGSAYYTNGFGFLGTANIPYPYDHFTETQDSVALLDLPNGSQTLGAALTSDHVYWDGANGMEGVGGGRPRLYAPENYQVGSSYSHLNETSYAPGTPNSLMTPGL
ncbi:MAG TPA: fibronectin, partial [Flavobacteriales bacterium]|nr:fibronectin [Flavobacteriales bacterium]